MEFAKLKPGTAAHLHELKEKRKQIKAELEVIETETGHQMITKLLRLFSWLLYPAVFAVVVLEGLLFEFLWRLLYGELR